MHPKNPESGGSWGIMGGTFDPIHYGHLVLAERASEAFNLTGVLFIVSYNPPHRERKPAVSFEDRLKMADLATEDNEDFVASPIEKYLDGQNYTLHLVSGLKKEYPKARWNLILGADNIAIFDSWHKPEELVRQVKIMVGRRPGYDSQFEESPWSGKVETFDMPLLEISSTRIRQLIKQNKSARYLLPEKVRMYIDDRGLYR